MRKYLPYGLFVVGLFLLAGAAWYGWHTLSAAPAGAVPQTLAGLALAEQTAGAEAIAQIQNLHLGDFALEDGAVAMYGSEQAVVWVATTASDSAAAAMVTDMEQSIAQGNNPTFTPVGVYNFGGRPLFQVDGLNQWNFYFQSGAKVVWLSADQDIAEQAVTELMQFYP
jgi:hypothetical protein